MTKLESLIKLNKDVESGTLITGTGGPARQALGIELTRLGHSAFHGSLDAARALHEAVLPGWRWRIEKHYAEIWDSVQVVYSAEGVDNPSRAWLIAILYALIDQERGKTND